MKTRQQRFSRVGVVPFGRAQTGAALYVALVMLILMALIGVVGMQVAGLQEKMAANYLNTNLAFQASEAGVRELECFVEGTVNRTGTCASASVTIARNCSDGFDPTSWAAAKSVDVPQANRVSVREIGPCISGNSSLAMGIGPISDDPNPVFEITVYATNAAATANAAVDTIYRP